ncbi:hypothetical protein RB195_018407 [Necator americanus]|uniref:Phospholipid/glycerol acyltransferase domain-containing protein n=1 Tax=Necator americanus TaxID=51031 RepID=A0ABR1CDD9_NECAM
MILELLAIYASILLGCIISTSCLIVLGKSWGKLPYYYLRIVRWIQDFYPKVYPRSAAPWPAIIKKSPKNCLLRNKGSSNVQFSFLLHSKDLLELSVDAMHSGLEAIVQDTLSHAFDRAPSYVETLLRFTPHPQWLGSQKALFYLTLLFRCGFLLPIRMSFLLLSFVFLFGAGVVAVNKRLTDKEKTWIGIVYCKLFCCGMGSVTLFRNRHLRPRGSGVAVANHMTPNDIQVLFADTPLGAQYGYVITGQKHKGIIGYIESLANHLCSTYWVERKNASDRRDFLTEIIKKAKFGGPVLLFPEGYCSNNTQVLQFRKAIFSEGIRIYPVALKQKSRYGDAFWWDEQFYEYLLRVMCSWATYYDVTYLPSMTQFSHETNAEFAARVQAVICDVIDVPAGEFDGSLWYNKSERRRLLDLQKEICATALLSYHRDKEKMESDDGYYSVSSGFAAQEDLSVQVN